MASYSVVCLYADIIIKFKIQIDLFKGYSDSGYLDREPNLFNCSIISVFFLGYSKNLNKWFIKRY